MSGKLTHLSLFSGIGGLDLAAEMAGFVTVGQCEWADFPTKVLEKHWPDVPRWRDIRTLTGESFYERTGLRTVDVISGGFPCQPFSVAGQRKGKGDDRYLWPEMLRVIRELRPAWVLGENVPGIVNLALDQVLLDLENTGYTGQPFIIPACGVDAPHKRERICIVAYRSGERNGIGRAPENAAEAGGQGHSDAGRAEADVCGKLREDQSGVGGMAHGIHPDIFGADSDAVREPVQGNHSEETCGGGYYRKNLHELLEATPRGIAGRMNPTWIEWLMGYPTGWTELKHSETPSCPSNSISSSN